MMERNKIYNIDCGEGLKQIQNDTITFILTSPPYDNLRNYGNITEWNFEKFKVIAQEIKRILKDGGVCVWVVADATINGSETGSSFKQALYFKEIGLNLWDTMIYKKANPIPQNHRCQHYSYHHDEPTIDAWADFYDSSGDGFRRVYMCGLMEAAEAMGTDFKCEYKPEWEARNENKM